MKYLVKLDPLGGGAVPENDCVALNEDGSVKIKTTPKIFIPEFVDLGLPSGLLWASCNIGATKPEEYGLYFQWGDTVGYKGDEAKEHSDWKSYKYCQGTERTITKYCTYDRYGEIDNKTKLELIDDAASVIYGENYRMPTIEENTELIDNTIYSEIEIKGITVIKLSSKINNNFILLPLSGKYQNPNFDSYYGYLFSSTVDVYSPNYAHTIYFGHNYLSKTTYNRCYAINIRAVKESK